MGSNPSSAGSRCDPSSRLLGSAAGVLVLQLVLPPWSILLGLAGTLEVLWLVTALRGGWKPWLRRWALALWILLPFGLASLTLGLAPRGGSGPWALPVLWLRAWLCLQWAAWTMQSMTSEEFVGGLARLHLPGPMVETIALSLRYFHLLREESQRMVRARQARSAGRGGAWLWRLRTHGSFLGNLLLRTLSRSERVFLAMQARGYGAARPRQGHPKLGWLDRGLGLACAVVVAAALLYRLTVSQ